MGRCNLCESHAERHGEAKWIDVTKRTGCSPAGAVNRGTRQRRAAQTTIATGPEVLRLVGKVSWMPRPSRRQRLGALMLRLPRQATGSTEPWGYS